MHPVRPNIQTIASISAILFLVIFCGELLIFGAEWDVIGKAAAKSGVILTIIGVFWGFYIKLGWRLKPLRLWGLLPNVPDLRGRWEGTVCSNNKNKPRPFVIEISQTFNSISYRTFSRNSKGESVTAAIFVDENSQAFTVYSTWRETALTFGDPSSQYTFLGSSTWFLSITENTKSIQDDYFTDREPQTKGRLYLEWTTRELQNKF